METAKQKIKIKNFLEYRNKFKSIKESETKKEPIKNDSGKIESVILNEDEREFYEERAAIIEYEAGLPRVLAEQEALKLTLEYFRKKAG